jgi:hypothetical protein
MNIKMQAKPMKSVMLRLVAQKMENKLTFEYRISFNSGPQKINFHSVEHISGQRKETLYFSHYVSFTSHRQT